MEANEISPNDTQRQATKKPYEKPSFRFEQVFVTTALNCGKTSHVGSGCQSLSAS